MSDKTIVLCSKGSSFIESMVYARGRMTVRFKGNKSKYHYFFVPYNTFLKVATSESIGRAFGQEIKGVFPSKKITQGE